MVHCYQYPHPAVTTDIVVFTIQDEQLQVLLIRRASDPFQGTWALPGGFVDIDEDLNTGAMRELEEETGVTNIYFEQLYTFGRPDRDPRERTISVAYYALMPWGHAQPHAGSDAADARWFAVTALPELAFDHGEMIDMACKRVAAKFKYSTLALQLLPPQFTLGELQDVYEAVHQGQLDKRNFRKWILATSCIEETGQARRNGGRRPAKLYQAKDPGAVEIIK